MTMKQLIKRRKMLRLSFHSEFEIYSIQAKYYCILKLKDSIEMVKGSIKAPEISAKDVTEVHIAADDAEKGFRIYKKSITYQGRYVLDVSRTGKVWLVQGPLFYRQKEEQL